MSVKKPNETSIAPVLILHGTKDKGISVYRVEALYYDLLNRGKTAEFIKCEDACAYR